MKIEEKTKIKVVYTTREDFERTFDNKQLKKLDPDDNEEDVWIFVVLPHTHADTLSPEKFASLINHIILSEYE